MDYWARTYNVVIVKTSGNTGNAGANVTSPGKGWNVITVGGFDDHGNSNWSDDTMAGFSSWVNPSSGIEKPDVVAPAVGIMMVENNGVITTQSGTSFAAPQVSGLAALLMNTNPSLNIRPEAVKAIIMASAVHNIEDARVMPTGTDLKDGAGAIDANLAVQIAATGYPAGNTTTCDKPCWWSTDSVSISPDAFIDRTIKLIRGERVRVAIAWWGKVDSSYATTSLASNFNLQVLDSSATQVSNGLSGSANNSTELVQFVAPSTGEFTIRVRRAAGDSNSNESQNEIGIAWTKQATYLPDVRSNFDNWTSTIYIRNDGNWPRNGKVTFFNSDGTFASESPFSALPANAVWSTAILPPSGWAGAAIVDGNEDLSVVVAQERSSPYTIDSYTGVFSPTASVRIPIVQRNNGSIYSEIFIQNGGGTATNITLQFLPAPGYGTSASQVWNNIVPGGWVKVKTIDLNYIGTGTYPNNVFVGSVLVTNSANQPLAIASTQYKNSGTTNHLYETSNTQPLAKALYAPLTQNGNNLIYSGLALNQASGGTFTVNYYDNPAPSTSCQNNQLTNATHWIIYPAPSAPPTPTPSPCNAITFAKLDATNDMVANVNQTKANGQATTYAAISTPSKAVSLPKVRVDDDWDDGFVVANYNGVAANITVNFYNATGTANSSPVYAISSNQHLTLYGATIPANFNGSVVVTSDQPVVVMVNSSKIGAGDFQGSYPGIHR